MFSGRYTHYSNVLEHIYREYGFEVDRNDVLEYIWDIIGIMGRPEILISDVKDVEIKDYKGSLPADLYFMVGCRDKKSKVVLRKNTSFYNNNIKQNSQGAYYETAFNKVEENGVLINDTVINSFIIPNFDINEFFSDIYYSDYVYNINNGTIFTNINNVVLEVAYLGFPVWEDGTPMIPEDSKVLRAVVDYIAEKVAFKMMLTDRINERKWKFVEEKSLWSMSSAINYMKIPDYDLMESIRINSIRIIPRGNFHSSGFQI